MKKFFLLLVAAAFLALGGTVYWLADPTQPNQRKPDEQRHVRVKMPAPKVFSFQLKLRMHQLCQYRYNVLLQIDLRSISPP